MNMDLNLDFNLAACQYFDEVGVTVLSSVI